MRGRPIAPLVLSQQQRTYLERQVRRHRVVRSLSDRPRDAAMRGWIAKRAVAAELVFAKLPLASGVVDFLRDRCQSCEARSGRPRTINDDRVAAVIERILRTTPADATHWSIRPIAAELAFPATRAAECGQRSASSRTGARHSSCRAIQCSSTRCATSSAFIYPCQTEPLFSASVRKATFRRSIASNRSCR